MKVRTPKGLSPVTPFADALARLPKGTKHFTGRSVWQWIALGNHGAWQAVLTDYRYSIQAEINPDGTLNTAYNKHSARAAVDELVRYLLD